MPSKKVNPLEEHFEKGLLGLAAIVLLYTLFAFVLGSSVGVQIGGQTVGPGEAYKKVRDLADQIDQKVRDQSTQWPKLAVPVSDNGDNHTALELTGLPDSLKGELVAAVPPSSQARDNVTPPPQYDPPVAVAPRKLVFSTGRLVLDLNGLDYLQTLLDTGETEMDCSYVTVAGEIDLAAQRQNMDKALGNLSGKLEREPIFLQANLQRAPVVPGGRDEDLKWEDVPCTLDTKAMLLEPGTFKVDSMTTLTAKIALLMQNGSEIESYALDPEFPPTVNRGFDVKENQHLDPTQADNATTRKVAPRAAPEAPKPRPVPRRSTGGGRGRPGGMPGGMPGMMGPPGMMGLPGGGRGVRPGRGGGAVGAPGGDVQNPMSAAGETRRGTRPNFNQPGMMPGDPRMMPGGPGMMPGGPGMPGMMPGMMPGGPGMMPGDPRMLPRGPGMMPGMMPGSPGMGMPMQGQSTRQPMRLSNEEHKKLKTLKVMVHDLTAVPGRTYKYRLRAVLFNPLAGYTYFLKHSEDTLKLGIPGPWSAPTPAIPVEPERSFFVSGTGEGGKSATVIVYKKYAGWYYKEVFDVLPGKPIGTKKPINNVYRFEQDGLHAAKKELDFTTGAVLQEVTANAEVTVRPPSGETRKETATVVSIKLPDGQVVKQDSSNVNYDKGAVEYRRILMEQQRQLQPYRKQIILDVAAPKE